MSELLEQVSLRPEQEKNVSSERARRYLKIRLLEHQLQAEKNALVVELSEEEVKSVESTLNEEVIDDVPKYLSVAEVAAITGLSPQMVRRHCASGKFQGYQPSGPNGIWYVKSDTFRKNREEWREFMTKRNKMFYQSIKVSEQALKLQDEDLEDIDTEE